MLSIRKVKTKSGTTAIQVVVYEGHKTKIIKHIGSGKNQEELTALHQKANEFIEEYSGQLRLSQEDQQRILFVNQCECIAVTHQFARNFFFELC